MTVTAEMTEKTTAVDQYITTMEIKRFRRTKAEKEAGLTAEQAAQARLDEVTDKNIEGSD